MGINEGDVSPAGNSGRFIVKDREITGFLTDGDIVGPFTLTYGANVPLETQSGQAHGTIDISNFNEIYEAHFQAGISIGLIPIEWIFGSDDITCGEITCGETDNITDCIPDDICIEIEPYGTFLAGLVINGTMVFTDGTQGNGILNAWVIATLDEEGHVDSFFAGGVTIDGQWKE